MRPHDICPSLNKTAATANMASMGESSGTRWMALKTKTCMVFTDYYSLVELRHGPKWASKISVKLHSYSTVCVVVSYSAHISVSALSILYCGTAIILT